MPFPLACVLMVACVPTAPGPSGDDPVDALEDDPLAGGDTEDLPPCTSSGSHWSWPPDGYDQFYAGDALFFYWSDRDGEELTGIEVETSSGQQVAGTTTEERNAYAWSATSGLDFDAWYTAKALLETCSISVDFATNDLGSAPVDLDCLEDATYLVDLGSARWIEPAGVGPLLEQQLDALYVQAREVSGTSLSAMAAFGDGAGNQDLCEQTVDLPPATFSNPDWEIPKESATLFADGLELAFQEFHVTGTFYPDCASVGNVDWTAVLDTKPLDAQTGSNSCANVQTFGVNCVACPYGDRSITCIYIEVEDVRGDKVPLDLTPVSQDDASECD